jgi:hypothetical protein
VTGIVDIRTGNGVNSAKSNRKMKNNQTNSPGVIFDEKQMMTVKIMRSTLEKVVSKKVRTAVAEGGSLTQRTLQLPANAQSTSNQFKVGGVSAIASSTYVKVLDRMKGHLMKKPN